MMRRGVRLLSLGLSILAAGCDTRSGSDSPAADNARQPSATLNDSMGVRVVAQALGLADAQLGSQPLVRLDSIPRTVNAELHQVTGVAFLSGDRLVVAHSSTSELLFFDASAESVTVVGGDGAGPGEFRRIDGIWTVDDDRIATYDRALRRFTVFNEDGTLARVQTITPEVFPDSLGSVWTGLGLTSHEIALLWLDVPRPEYIGIVRPEMSVLAVDSAGVSRSVGGMRPGLERYTMRPESDGSFSMGLSPFAPTPLVAPCGSRIAVADNQTYGVTLFGSTGDVELVLRADVAPRLAKDGDYHAIRMARFGTYDTASGALDVMRMMTPSGLLPVLKSVLCDRGQNLWVEEWPDAEAGVARVTSYDRDGTRRFTVNLAADMQLLAVTPDRIAVARRDADGAEYLEVYVVQNTHGSATRAQTPQQNSQFPPP